jgi:hypothetical protein
MNTFRYIIASLVLLLSISLNAQTETAFADMNFELKLMDDNTTWGVFVVPGETIAPSKRSTTGSGQVTIVAPVGFVYAGLENFGGSWIENSRVDGPMEAPDQAYISFGFVSDEPRIKYVSGKETLLFTFIPEDANVEVSLFDNQNDPFATPNTYGSNPGNDLGVIDFDRNGDLLVYNYGQNLEVTLNASKSSYASKKSKENSDKKEEGAYKAVFTSEKIATPNH